MLENGESGSLTPREVIDVLVNSVGGPDVVRAMFTYANRQPQALYDGVSLVVPGEMPGGVQLDYYRTTGDVHFKLGTQGTHVVNRCIIEAALLDKGPDINAA